MPAADVTVMGAGIFGLSVAWACAQRGARVRVIDPGGAGAGASGGIVGALAPHVPEGWNDKKAFQFDSLMMAETFWHQVAEASGLSPGYARLGRLQPVTGAGGAALARERGVSAQDLWQGKALWQVIDANTAGRFAPACADGLLIRDTLSARVHPRRACAALAGALCLTGGVIAPDGPAQGIVIHATGVADLAAIGAARGHTAATAIKGQAALLGYEARHAPQIFAEGLHIVPHEDGTTAIGSTTERGFDTATRTDAQLDTLIARARATVPALDTAPVLARWAGLRPRTRSRGPVMGPHPLHPGRFIANGGFKIGFGIAPKVAQVMADLMLDGVDRIPPAFRPGAAL